MTNTNADTITTWANGFGVWHARVPAGARAQDIARAAIREELVARGAMGDRFMLRVKKLRTGPAQIHSTIAGTVVYSEA